MKVLILTTNTLHHTYFVNKFKSKYKNTFVICESKKIKFRYKTFHKFEKKRDEFEKKIWFNNTNISLKNQKKVKFVSDINKLNYKKFKFNDYKIIFVFGIGIISKDLLKKINCTILNFHGGDPEKYRGLDSHLWAILDKKYNQLFVTLHKLEVGIDTGDILFKKKIVLKKNMQLFQLRKINTEICLDFALKTLDRLLKNKKLIYKKQKKVGKYFSAMSAYNKNKCNILFKKFTNKIK